MKILSLDFFDLRLFHFWFPGRKSHGRLVQFQLWRRSSQWLGLTALCVPWRKISTQLLAPKIWIQWEVDELDEATLRMTSWFCPLYIYVYYIYDIYVFFVFGDFFVDLNLGTPWPIQSWQCTVTVGKGLKLHLGAEAWHKKNANRKKGIQRWNPWLNLLLSILSRTVRMWTYWLINFFQWCSTIRWSTWDGKTCCSAAVRPQWLRTSLLAYLLPLGTSRWFQETWQNLFSKTCRIASFLFWFLGVIWMNLLHRLWLKS